MQHSRVQIDVLYFGPIKDAVGIPEERVHLPPGATVGDLLTVLSERHGDRFREALLGTDGTLLPNAVFVLDGRNILHEQGTETPIVKNGTVHLLVMASAVGGG